MFRSITLTTCLAAALALPLTLSAQRAGRGDSGSALWLGAGWTFPSGGDWSDTYNAGPHAMADVSFDIAPRWAIRAGVTAAEFAPQAPRGHVRDGRDGETLALDVGALYTPPILDDRAYLIGGAGMYAVRGTWLTATNTIDRYHTQNTFGVEAGVGMRVGERWFLEMRHHLAFRPVRGWARFIPVTFGYRF